MTVDVGRALVSDSLQHGVDHDEAAGAAHPRTEREIEGGRGGLSDQWSFVRTACRVWVTGSRVCVCVRAAGVWYMCVWVYVCLCVLVPAVCDDRTCVRGVAGFNPA